MNAIKLIDKHFPHCLNPALEPQSLKTIIFLDVPLFLVSDSAFPAPSMRPISISVALLACLWV